MTSFHVRTSTSSLEYQPAAARGGRALLRRGVAVLAIVAVLVLGGRWVGPAWRHVQLLYWQSKCLSFSPPAGRVVLTRQTTDGEGASAISMAQEVAPAWDRFYEVFNPPGRKGRRAVFVREMRAAPGAAGRLVAVDVMLKNTLGPVSGSPSSWPAFDIHVIEPGTAWSAARLIRNLSAELPAAIESKEGGFKLLAGEIDSTNAAHFTIAVETGGKVRQIDGWLLADDRVLMELRE